MRKYCSRVKQASWDLLVKGSKLGETSTLFNQVKPSNNSSWYRPAGSKRNAGTFWKLHAYPGQCFGPNRNRDPKQNGHRPVLVTQSFRCSGHAPHTTKPFWDPHICYSFCLLHSSANASMSTGSKNRWTLKKAGTTCWTSSLKVSLDTITVEKLLNTVLAESLATVIACKVSFVS